MSDVLKHSLDKELLITQAIRRDARAEFKDTHIRARTHRPHSDTHVVRARVVYAV